MNKIVQGYQGQNHIYATNEKNTLCGMAYKTNLGQDNKPTNNNWCEDCTNNLTSPLTLAV